MTNTPHSSVPDAAKSILPGPAARPKRTKLVGSFVDVVPLDASSHAESLYEAIEGQDQLWDYLFDEPPSSFTAFSERLQRMARSDDPLYFAIVEKSGGGAVGYASYLRIEPPHRVIEVGSILYSPRLQKTAGATEAMYLMARHVFEDLGYRRYEWKCNNENAASRRAAVRLGFTFEGIFRQHMIIKGKNRDTAWFSMLDSEWPARKANFERWLTPSNFDAGGRQKTSLSLLNQG